MLLPTAYCPNIAYFFQLLNSNQVTISSEEFFIRQTLRNRCIIVNANGLQNLTVPVARDQGHETLTKNIRISYAEDWVKNHLRSIESAYRRTPYYEYYIENFAAILEKKHTLLLDLNFELLQFFIDKIGLRCELNFTPESQPVSSEMNKLVDAKSKSSFTSKTYLQTFTERHGFQNNLSILDLLFNEGPNSICILEESTI